MENPTAMLTRTRWLSHTSDGDTKGRVSRLAGIGMTVCPMAKQRQSSQGITFNNITNGQGTYDELWMPHIRTRRPAERRGF